MKLNNDQYKIRQKNKNLKKTKIYTFEDTQFFKPKNLGYFDFNGLLII